MGTTSRKSRFPTLVLSELGGGSSRDLTHAAFVSYAAAISAANDLHRSMHMWRCFAYRDELRDDFRVRRRGQPAVPLADQRQIFIDRWRSLVGEVTPT